MVDVTRKDLYLDFPLMTKAGTPWRCKGGYRTNWKEIESQFRVYDEQRKKSIIAQQINFKEYEEQQKQEKRKSKCHQLAWVLKELFKF